MLLSSTTKRTVTLLPLVAALLGGAVACEPASIEGTSYGGDSAKSTKRRQNAERDEDPAPTSTPADSAPETTPPPESEDPAPPPSTPDPEPPPPPPPQQPSCQSANPGTCFNCCINANPGAIALENAFDDCLLGCFDSACDNACRIQHVGQCQNNAACVSHHACLQANDCAQQNFCF